MFSVGFQRFKADVAIYLHDKGCIANKVSPADRVEKEKEVSLSFVKIVANKERICCVAPRYVRELLLQLQDEFFPLRLCSLLKTIVS